MALLSLSYDAPKENYEEISNFRKALIEVLLTNGALKLKSFVASTIYFETSKQRPLETWENILHDTVGSGLRFTISKVATDEDGKYAFIFKGHRKHRMNFVEEVESVVRKLGFSRGSK
jgi:hypothetical protein